MTIKLNDKEIELKYSLRSMLMYENITEKTFNPTSLTDVLTFMYCVVIASSKDYSIKFDDFIDYVDENPNTINDFGDWVQDIMKTNNIFKKK